MSDIMHPRRLSIGDMEIAASVAGDPRHTGLLLLHGWPQSRALYDDVLDPLSRDFLVIAPDLPAIGDSRGAPPSADKATLADIVIAAAEQAGARDLIVAGLDVGGMIAFAAAREHGARIAGAVVINTVVPGLDPWAQLLADPRVWHFAFHALPDLPERLVRGRERDYFDYFTDILSGDPARIPEPLRARFAAAYAMPEALAAGFDWYRTMAADAARNAASARITTPLRYVRGDADGRPIAPYLASLSRAGVERLTSEVVPDSGELLPIEAPDAFVRILREFRDRALRDRRGA